MGRLWGSEAWPLSREWKLCQILKDYTMTHRSRPPAPVNRIFLIIWALNHMLHSNTVLFFWSLWSSNTNLQGSRSRDGQLSLELSLSYKRWTTCEHVKFGMLRLQQMIITVIQCVIKLCQVDNWNHCEIWSFNETYISHRAGKCYESCYTSRSWLECQHYSGLSLDQVTRWLKSWTGYTRLLFLPFSTSLS